MRRAHGWLTLALVGLSACGQPAATPQLEAKRKAPTSQQLAAKPAAPVAPPLYDAAGNLLPSEARVAWLELPRGLTAVPTGMAEHHAFRAQGIAIDRIQAFFGARLVAREVKQVGNGGVRMSQGVPPEGMRPKLTILDVTVTPAQEAGAVVVRIDERPFVPPVPSFTDADARSLLKQEQKRAE